jgi:ubiquinone/menaquinone biosynthesis C-methylase UbiE
MVAEPQSPRAPRDSLCFLGPRPNPPRIPSPDSESSDTFDVTTYESTASFFDDTAGMYDDWFLRDVHYMRLLASIVERVRAYRPRHIVELGCGTGNLSLLLGKHLPEAEITAVDISSDLLEQAVAKCSSQPNVSLVEADMMSMVASMPSDASIVANYSLHHLTDEHKHELCEQLSRSLAHGSAVVIGDVLYPPPPPPPRAEMTTASSDALAMS